MGQEISKTIESVTGKTFIYVSQDKRNQSDEQEEDFYKVLARIMSNSSKFQTH